MMVSHQPEIEKTCYCYNNLLRDHRDRRRKRCLEAGLEDPRPGVLGRSGVTAVLLCKPSCSEMNKMKNSLLLQGEINPIV